MPAISVILPVYNGEKYLREAVSSILNQTFNDFEFIIVNDASSDNSHTIIQSYSDDRIIYLQNSENQGLVGALNRGIRHATGKYIARMDQDDISMPNRLKLQYEFLEKNYDHVIVGTYASILGTNSLIHYPCLDKDIRAGLVFAPNFIHPTVMIRGSIFFYNNLSYEEKYKHAEDYGLWINLASFGKMANLPISLLSYRKHESQYTVTLNKSVFETVARIRHDYLKILGIDFEYEAREFFDNIAMRKINYFDKNEVHMIGQFLSRFPQFFKNLPFQDAIEKLAYKNWRRICGEREKQGYSSLKLFLSSPIGRTQFDFYLHLAFLKNYFLLKS